MNNQINQLTRAPELPRPPVWSRLLPLAVPAGLLAGFALLAALLFGDRLLPATEVTTGRVVTLRAGDTDITNPRAVADASGRSTTPPAPPDRGDLLEAPMSFQATGWIEADPYPIKVPVLVDGVVDSVEVLEGETVRAGQTLATLIDEDARLDLETARSELAGARAAAESHHGLIAMAEAKVESTRLRIVEAEARLRALEDLARRAEAMGADVASEEEIVQSRLRAETQAAAVQALRSSEIEERANLDRHRTMHAEFDARIAGAETEVARRELALGRTRVTSPMDGVVQRLLVSPGDKRMLGMDDKDSAVVAILFQPGKLQARIDVPLAEAAGLSIGQAVRIKTGFLPDAVFPGEVTRIVGEADLQRNTLQVKVRIDDPHPALRPEMLCRAEFLERAPDTGDRAGRGPSQTAAASRVRVFVPENALVNRRDGQAEVWLLDEDGERLARRAVRLGTERRADHVAAVDGLHPGDRVVTNPASDLREAMRVRPRNTEQP